MEKSELRTAVVNANDTDVAEYKKDILEYLEDYSSRFSTHAMSQHQLTLQGQKRMLDDIIDFIKRN